jgi:two-component system CheB/CheR fusion protein
MKKNPKLAESSTEKSQTPDEDFPIVGMGASAGGIEALEKFFNNMPHDSGIAFVIVMHFDPASRSFMAEILKRYTKIWPYFVESSTYWNLLCERA